MPRRVRFPQTTLDRAFGTRLREMRQARGLTQEELAQEIGISRRMLVYYELHAEKPPAHLLLTLSRALAVSADELLGVKAVNAAKNNGRPQRSRLWERFKRIQSLPPPERRAILKVIDSLLTRKQA